MMIRFQQLTLLLTVFMAQFGLTQTTDSLLSVNENIEVQLTTFSIRKQKRIKMVGVYKIAKFDSTRLRLQCGLQMDSHLANVKLNNAFVTGDTLNLIIVNSTKEGKTRKRLQERMLYYFFFFTVEGIDSIPSIVLINSSPIETPIRNR